MTVRLPAVAALALAASACGPTLRPALAPTLRPAASAAAPRGDATRAANMHAAVTRVAVRGVPATPVAPELSPADVAARVTAMFGTSLDAVHAGASTSPGGPAWDIDVRSYETHARVSHYVALFAGPGRDRMGERIQRGTRYEPMIRRKLRQSGLPEDFTYLALIESGYSPHAYSRAAAVGMWQLMAETARDGGLRVDGWVDERRDPVRSTEAAIRFLRWLRGEFGSMYLAAAAYNGGPGRIARGLTRFSGDMQESTGDGFFTLAAQDYLPRETKEYVPQLIAAALVAKYPERYGIHVRPLPEFAYDSARVPALTPLAAVAAASGATVAELLDLNPQYLRGIVPPGDGAMVRVPVGRGAGFAAAFGALPERDRRGVTRVQTRKQQTLADLARATGRSPQLLTAFNPRLAYGKKKRLVPGQAVLVPTVAVAAAARDLPSAPARARAKGTGSVKAARGEAQRTKKKGAASVVAAPKTSKVKKVRRT